MNDIPAGRKRLIHSAAFGTFFTRALTVISVESGSERLARVLLWPAGLVSSVLDPHPKMHGFPLAFVFGLMVEALFYSMLAYLVLRLIKR